MTNRQYYIGAALIYVGLALAFDPGRAAGFIIALCGVAVWLNREGQ